MNISATLLEFAISVINQIGYVGISLILIADNAGAPIPSEAILALSGAASRAGELNIFVVFFIGVVMQTVGSIAAYYIGAFGGAPLIERYGKYVLISKHDYQKTHAWFEKNGEKAIFVSRLVPVVRTYMGFVAGGAGMSFRSFVLQTALGSFVWSVVWIGFGYVVGEEWRRYYDKLHYLDYIVVIVVFLIIIRFVLRKLRRRQSTQEAK